MPQEIQKLKKRKGTTPYRFRIFGFSSFRGAFLFLNLYVANGQSPNKKRYVWMTEPQSVFHIYLEHVWSENEGVHKMTAMFWKLGVVSQSEVFTKVGRLTSQLPFLVESLSGMSSNHKLKQTATVVFHFKICFSNSHKANFQNKIQRQQKISLCHAAALTIRGLWCGGR